ncbi:MAG: SDR family oxidoreductase [Planctomycetes bacterium]|nr:SDR family oxidoreductase [Planctomycetota bacterium]
MGVEGLTAIVTGAARGIGKAIAAELAGRGANLALCDIDASGLAAAASALAAGHPALTVLQRRVDVAREDEIRDFVGFTDSALGPADILVNNAGIYILKPIEEIGVEEWDRVLAVNLRSVFLFTREVLPGMRTRKFGRIINIASAAGISGGTVCGSHYAASKGGMLAFTRHLAKQVGQEGVTVNAVAPSSIAADMVLNLPPHLKQKAIDATVVKRLGTTEEVAAAAAFLADRNSGFITGETLQINGGCIMS